MADIATLFEKMPEQFNAAAAAGVNATIYFELSGENSGNYYVVIADGKLEVEKGTPESPTATLKMDGDDYSDMVTGKLNPMTAFMTGKVKVEGDLATVMKMQSLFGM